MIFPAKNVGLSLDSIWFLFQGKIGRIAPCSDAAAAIWRLSVDLPEPGSPTITTVPDPIVSFVGRTKPGPRWSSTFLSGLSRSSKWLRRNPRSIYSTLEAGRFGLVKFAVKFVSFFAKVLQKLLFFKGGVKLPTSRTGDNLFLALSLFRLNRWAIRRTARRTNATFSIRRLSASIS